MIVLHRVGYPWPASHNDGLTRRSSLKVVSKYDRGFHTVGNPVQAVQAAHIEGR